MGSRLPGPIQVEAAQWPRGQKTTVGQEEGEEEADLIKQQEETTTRGDENPCPLDSRQLLSSLSFEKSVP